MANQRAEVSEFQQRPLFWELFWAEEDFYWYALQQTLQNELSVIPTDLPLQWARSP